MSIKVKWNIAGFRELRTMPAVQKILTESGERIAAASGEGYVTDSDITSGRGRARTAVITGDFRAMLDTQRNNTLLKSLDAGRYRG